MGIQTLNDQYNSLISAFILHFEKKHNLENVTKKRSLSMQFVDSNKHTYYVALDDIIQDNLPFVKKEYFMQWYKLDQFYNYKDFIQNKIKDEKASQ